MTEDSEKNSVTDKVELSLEEREAQGSSGGRNETHSHFAGDKKVDRWITTRWELWAFYVYYIVSPTIPLLSLS
jgi:hypothetical protein